MRKLKITTILFLSGVSVCLCAILVLALGGKGAWAHRENGSGTFGRENYSLVLEREAPAEDIRRLRIDYGMTFNDVHFYEAEGNQVLIREYMNFEPAGNQISKVEQKGDELVIKGARRNHFALFSFHSWNAYTEIYLPSGLAESLEEMTVKTTSGDVRSQVPLGAGKNFTVNSTSGDLYFTEVKAEHLSAGSTSGNVSMETLVGTVSVSTTSGDISLGQTEGNIKISSTSGEVRTAGVQGDAEISTTSGDISLGKIDGDMDLSSTSGNIRLQEGKGRFGGETTSGDVRLEQLEGDFHISTSSGETTLRSGSGWGKVGTVSGDVGISLEALTGDLTVSTTSGEVDLGLPENVSMTLDFDSSSGDCSTFFDEALQFNKKGSQARGQYGTGERAVSVSTVSGDLYIRQKE